MKKNILIFITSFVVVIGIAAPYLIIWSIYTEVKNSSRGTSELLYSMMETSPAAEETTEETNYMDRLAPRRK